MENNKVYVSGLKGLARTVKVVLPHIEVVEVHDTFWNITDENIDIIQKNADILLAKPPIIARVLNGPNKLRWAQTVTAGTSGNDRLRLISDAEIMFGDLPVIVDTVDNSTKIKWAQSTWAGVEYLTKAMKKPPDGVQITRMGDGFGDHMAEYLIGYLIAKQRGFFEIYDNQKRRDWDRPRFLDFKLLSSSTIGILGAGAIGKKIASVCKTFGLTVWGLSRDKRADNENSPFDVLKSTDELPELLKECDYLCSVLPKTASTNDILSGDVLSHCKDKSPEFINIGRGNIINEESLIKALNNKWLRGAVLDVYEQEPIPKDSPIWSMPNVIITPHISGPCISENIAKIFASNYNKFIEGKPLDYTINWDAGY